jgi:hypothetical protein
MDQFLTISRAAVAGDVPGDDDGQTTTVWPTSEAGYFFFRSAQTPSAPFGSSASAAMSMCRTMP